MSEMASVIQLCQWREKAHAVHEGKSPTCLRHAWDEHGKRVFSEGAPRAAELAEERVPPAGLGATIDHAHGAGVLGQLGQRGVVLLFLQFGSERGVFLHRIPFS